MRSSSRLVRASRRALVLAGLWVLGVSPATAQGTVRTPIGSGNDEAFAVVLQPDGKIVAAGFSQIGGQDVFAVVRYNHDSTLDTSFDGDGIVTTTVGVEAQAQTLALQPDGKIVVAGFANLGLGAARDFAVIRYNANGSLDTTFDSDGIAVTAIGAGAADDQGRDVAIGGYDPVLGGYKIVVAGYSHNGANYDFAVVRYNPNGTLDTSFDTDGKVTTNFPSARDDKGEAVGLLGDQIVVAGDVDNGVNWDYGVARYNANGSLDTSFDTDGMASTNFLGSHDFARALLIQPDNKVVVAGSSDNAGNSDISLARYNTNGSLDPTFDGDGRVTTAVGAGFDASYGIARQPGGALVVAGWGQVGGGIDFMLVRYNANGSLDTSFDGDGKVTTDFGSSANDFGYAIAIEPDGKLVAVGSSHNGSNLDVGLARYCSTGSLLGPYQATSAYGYRKALTVASGQVSGTADLVDFPVLVDITDSQLRTTPLGRVQRSDGADIVFRSACGGAALDHEIELYNSASGRLVAWVKVPLVQPDVDTVIYMYYGNAGVTCSTQNAAGVWSSGYRGVWHLNEAAAGPFGDSTSQPNDGIVAAVPPIAVVGKINGAMSFDAPTDRHIAVIDHTSLRLPTSLSVSAWVTEATPDAQNRVILAKWGNNPGVDQNYWLGNMGGTTLSFFVDNAGTSVSTPLAAIQGGGWHHVVGVADAASGLLRLYVDGTQLNTAAWGGTTVTGNSPLHFSDNPGSTFQYWVGGIDEGRVASGIRSAGWIQTEFNNQNSPGTFLAVGPEVQCPCGTTNNPRSVGTAPSPLYNVGTATVALGGAIVDFGVPANLPTTVRLGDRLVIGAETLFVLARVTSTRVTVQSPATAAHSAEPYTISRAYGTIQAWETDRQGNLVGDDRQEIAVLYDDGDFLSSGSIDGSTTDACHFMRVTVPVDFRHNGIAGAGVVVDGNGTDQGLRVSDDYTVVEGLELKRIFGAASAAGVVVQQATNVLLQNLLIHDYVDATNLVSGIRGESDASYTVRNSIFYNGDRAGVRNNNATATGLVQSCTAYNIRDGGTGTGMLRSAGSLTVTNTLSLGNDVDFGAAITQSYNISSDGTAAGTGSLTLRTATANPAPGPGNWVVFSSLTPGSENLHLQSSVENDAVDSGLNLSAAFSIDIDSATRLVPWDIGADDLAATTAVELMSFSAVAGDGSVLLEWRTGSELDNLGFHVYRGLSGEGPWTRLTSSLIAGLGSSPLGQAYSWLDTGLANGVRYYYRLEDVDTASVSTFHGPVSAVPVAASSRPGEDGGDDGGGDAGGGGGETARGACPEWILAAAPDAVSPSCTAHGSPEAVSLQVLSRTASGATLELQTGGFWTLEDASGTVRVFVPGLGFPADANAPALPVRRALVDAVVGKQVRLVSAQALELQSFPELRPSAVGQAEMAVGRDGTIRPSRRSRSARLLSRGLVPQEVARLAGTVFQGERKSAVVEITPVRFSASRNALVLAGRVRVRLSFARVAEGELPTRGGGRAVPRKDQPQEVLAQLHTARRGLHAVSYEDLFPTSRRGVSTALLRLQRQGEAVSFHVEPSKPVFGPGSVLYFDAERTVSSTEYSGEVAYELVRGAGEPMGMVSAPPAGTPLTSPSTGFASFETNRIYQPGLLEAGDIWLWDAMASGVVRRGAFALSGVDATSLDTAQLVVFLQGGSESGIVADHHVQLSVNGSFVGETTFTGKRPQRVDVLVPLSLLREGSNELSVTNVGDTGVYSLVFLDRFELRYPQAAAARGGVFEGVWAQSGTVEVGGLSGPAVVLRETSGPAGSAVKWLTGFQVNGSSVRFQAEAGYRYTVVSPEGLPSPRIGRVPASTLKAGTNQADYLVIAPREFLEAAQPLVERRSSQGLVSRAVPFEEIASEFGYGQPSAEAIRAFLEHAYHWWQAPSPRYVVLLGDATYDPRRFLATSSASPLPALWEKTSYLWTVSDPALAAVNGDDFLPDLALGRLPATSREQAQALVSKLLAWEDSGQGLSGDAVLVADVPDRAGDFETNVEDIYVSFLAGRSTTTLKVRELGAGTRPAILGSFDDGASLVSYVGHGGTAVWSSANVLNSWDAPSLQAQSRQPLLLTLNCLNGYFVAPNHDSLSESLVKVEGRGAVAAVSPSGLSLDGPAHQYHRALMAELTGGTHERLGDAILAAQRTYSETGLMPELLTIYQLLGDPATRIR